MNVMKIKRLPISRTTAGEASPRRDSRPLMIGMDSVSRLIDKMGGCCRPYAVSAFCKAKQKEGRMVAHTPPFIMKRVTIY